MLPPFCEGCPDEKFLLSFRVIPYEKFTELNRIVRDHASFFRRFIRYYQDDIPHYLVSSVQDLDTLGFYEAFGIDQPSLTPVRRSAWVMLALGDYFVHTGDAPKAANIYFLAFKCGMDLELGFGCLQNMLNHIVAIAIQRDAFMRLVSLYASRTLNGSLEKTFLNRYLQTRGQYPVSLQELQKHFATQVPVDVFTGKDCLYQRENGTFRLHSPGPDGNDDGFDKEKDSIIFPFE